MIKLDTFYLEKLDIAEKHYGLIEGMSLDKKVKAYIDRDFFVWLGKHQAISDDKIEVGKMYAVIKDGREIGVVGSSGDLEDGILNVVCAIKKNVRDRGYGTKLLEEVTFYYLENIKGIKGIKLVIDQSNKASRGIAINNGFVKIDGVNEVGLEEWYYSKSRIRERK